MPTYEYACNQCGREFEKVQRITEPAQAECPACGSSDTRRLISHSSFILKGSGWYVTDYARKNGGGNGGSSHHKTTKSTVSEASSPAPSSCASGACGTSCAGASTKSD